MRRAAPFLLLLLLAMGLSLLAAPQGQRVEDELERPSTFFTDETGARALLLVCEELLEAEVVRKTLDGLELKPDTLIVAGPQRPLSDVEAEHLHEWLAQGGQLILATRDGWPGPPADGQKAAVHTFLEDYDVTLKCHDVSAQGWRVGDLLLHMRGGAKWEGDFQVLARSGKEVLAVAIPVEKGRIVAVCDPLVVSNQALSEGDNSVWLLNLCAGHGRVLFDEYHQGFGDRSGLLEMIFRFLKTPWGLAFGQLALAGLLTATALRARLGRSVRPRQARLRDPLVLLEARAGLLQSAEARSLALEQICAHLCHQLSDAGGRPADLAALQGRAEPARLERLLALRARPTLTTAELLEGAQLACQIREELVRVR